MQPRIAIVLKQISPYKVALFDKQEGRLDGIVPRSLHLGSMVEYHPERSRGTTVFISDLQLLDLPFHLGRSDILFWHHILELCFYCMPVGSRSPELFELLLFLYTMDIWGCWNAQSKKLYLCKLLITIGWYHEVRALSVATLQYIRALPVDHIHEVKLDEESEKRVDEWLRVCVAEHPAIGKFKTMHFLRGE